MRLKTVVVDDEARALKLIVDYVGKTPSLELVASFQNAIEALEYLNQNPVDLLLTDIQMPDITGLELLDSLQTKPMVIFTTAYPEYAVEGFQLDAVDYLVKPVMLPRFLKAANKAVKQAALLNPTPPAQTKTAAEPIAESGYLFVKVDSHFTRLQLTNIRYIEGSGDYVAIYLADNRKLLSLQTLTQMMARLPGNDFYRVHRSYIVNLNHVDTVEKDHLLIGDADITIGKSYRGDFFRLLSDK
ncbi:MAG: LytTR family DNA-binding domain-containing protein [Psychrosphaera sp.]|nr:LytTR family DNA-binding domain-containing protein [Psychrosphaera sp.]